MAATLADIRKKVRLITRSPSASQMTDNDIDDYVNNFLLYDFPEHLRLFTFRKTFTFYTLPNIAVYETSAVATDPLYDFKNAYITSHDPVYIGGYKAYFTQSRNDFFGLYPEVQSRIQIGTGDGVTVNFTGTLSSIPILRYNVLFNAVDLFGDGMVAYDELGDGDFVGDIAGPSTINYVTGVYDITFVNAPGDGEIIYAQTVPYPAGRPMAMLYFDNKFTLKPVPDISYQVRIETYVRPESLVHDAAAQPILEQHWSYVALGAAKRIFEDRMDMDSVQLIMPEFKQQELLCQRRTIVQQSNERVGTIYTQQLSGYNGYNNNYY